MSDVLYVFSNLDIGSIIDILLVALVFYSILTLIQGTQAVQVLRGILIVSVLAAIAGSAFDSLTAFKWLIDKALPALLVAIPVVFQPELRRVLERLGRTGTIFSTSRQNTDIEEAIEAVSTAAVFLSHSMYGALIVFERDTGLEDYIETGIRLDAVVTSDLLTTIFFPGTTLHDGAVIIRNNKIVAASTLFPLGGESVANRQMLGTRHRAALGITEVTDAVAVIVSEETGLISVAHNGQLIRGLDKKRLEQILRAFFKRQLSQELPKKLNVGHSLLRRLGIIKSNKTVIRAQSQTKQ